MEIFSGWMVPILASAAGLGFYDICKKHAVRNNPVMPVLFLTTLCGSTFFVLGTILAGKLGAVLDCGWRLWSLTMLKSLLVAASWNCVYYAMRELPISIASPIRASAPLWTFLGSIFLFAEIPTLLQGIAMFLTFTGYYCFSVLGKMEGLSFRKHRGIHMIFLGTLLGSVSALYDKYLLGVLGLPRDAMQFHFSVDLVLILGIALLVKWKFGKNHRPFQWRWSIPATGILLICSDFLYFYALSTPEAQISILSLVRRCGCIVTFLVGGIYFRDANVKRKAAALGLILLGVILLAVSR